MHKNIYKIAFPFRGEYEYTQIDSNQIANMAIGNIIGDYIYDICEDHNQFFEYIFNREDKKYKASFSHKDTNYINIYELFDNDGFEDEHIIEENIPYIILQINNDKSTLFNIHDII